MSTRPEPQCQSCIGAIDDYYDNVLDDAYRLGIRLHLNTCSYCNDIYHKEQKLRSVLSEMKSEPCREQLRGRIINSIEAQQKPNSQRAFLRGFGSAIAACLCLWLLGTNLFVTSSNNNYHPINMKINEAKTINMVFEVPQAYSNVTFSVHLPDNVELDGFPDQRSLSWNGDLVQGSNLLALRVKGMGIKQGTLITEIHYATIVKTFKVDLTVDTKNDIQSKRLKT